MNQFKKTTKKRERLRGIYFQTGLIIAGGLTLVAFEWTSPVNINELPVCEVIYDEEWDFPIILPEPEVEKPKVKYTEAPKKSEIIKIVIDIIDPILEPNPEPTPEPVFNPNEFETKEKIVEDEIHFGAEVMPEFKGGLKKLFLYLGENIKYPKREKNAGIQGTVHLEFVVGKKGEIKSIKILRGVNDAIDAEAIRVLKAMPNWKPGKQHGKAVNVRYTLPIKFLLN